MGGTSGIEQARKTAEALAHSAGFGNEHSSEAVPGRCRTAVTRRSERPSGSTPSS